MTAEADDKSYMRRKAEVKLKSQVSLSYVAVLHKTVAGSLHDNLAVFQQVRPIRHLQGALNILLNQQNGGSSLPQFVDGIENL